MNTPPKVWYFSRFLPRSWRLALLQGLAWPEFEVSRLVKTADGVETVPILHPGYAFRLACGLAGIRDKMGDDYTRGLTPPR